MTLRTIAASLALASYLVGGAWISPPKSEATEPLDAVFDCPNVGGLDYLLDQRTVLLLGEMHGTMESPRFVADLLCNVVASGRSAALALQLPEMESGVVSKYLDSEGSKEDRTELLAGARELSLYEDGRFSEAIVGLVESIRDLRAQGGEIELRLFVPSDVDSLTRQNLSTVEWPMAVKVWEAIEELEADLFIVLAGLTHSRVIRGSELNPDYEPMGFILTEWNPKWRLLSLALSHSGGTAWMCTTRNVVDCRPVPVTGGGRGDPNSIYIYGEPAETGHNGLYFVGDISHSPPAKADMVELEFEEQTVTELPFEPTPD